ncbi:MAG: hydroxymethylglutaryl-CoA lyase [Deltaproteobacteria bacterium]|nr:hydroxymethylglutaryl-CoA lyase [Deltaproteobacteria bacterium]
MSLPKRVQIVEVGPRDGLQAEDRFIPTELKIQLLEELAAAGLSQIEITSFVHPRVIPQMVDAVEVMTAAHQLGGVQRISLVPNLKGAQRALEAGTQELRLVACVTETYNRRNVGLTVAQSLEVFGEIFALAEPRGVAVAAVLAATFGCPFEGLVEESRVVDLARQFAQRGSAQIGLADSAGLGNPVQVRSLVQSVQEALPEMPLWLHFHDTRGLGIANALAGLEAGVTTFDTSFGGLGGCPIIKGATGNIATEDLVYALQTMGVETGVDLDRLRRASQRLARFLGRKLPSRVLAAGTHREMVDRNRQDQ